jgi:hypothetical protein
MPPAVWQNSGGAEARAGDSTGPSGFHQSRMPRRVHYCGAPASGRPAPAFASRGCCRLSYPDHAGAHTVNTPWSRARGTSWVLAVSNLSGRSSYPDRDRSIKHHTQGVAR